MIHHPDVKKTRRVPSTQSFKQGRHPMFNLLGLKRKFPAFDAF